VICRDHLAEPFLEPGASFAHGITFGGHPVSCAVALANLDIFEREDLLAHVRDHERGLEERLRAVAELPIVGDLRGAGYFWALELVKDQATQEPFTRAESEALLRGFLAPRLYELGLIARADDRGMPVVQVAPPLVAGPDELDALAERVHHALAEAGERR
jgi:adenosylmethionine-8-amino-7-oxononanoate aminotransferase